MVKVSTSILSIKENLLDNIKKINNTTSDFIHLDIMDGIFVNNKTYTFDEIEEIYKITNKPLDVHLMVQEPLKYIEEYKKINPSYITVHYEVPNYIDCIREIKKNNIKAGISIKPNTKVQDIFNILNEVDLVLIMSVEPGFGGQEFISNSINKINELKKYIDENNLDVLIEVDGGINDETSKKCVGAGTDILVSGSFITNSDNYQVQIDKLKN